MSNCKSRTIQSVKEFHLIGFITVTDLGTTGLEIFCISEQLWDFTIGFGLESKLPSRVLAAAAHISCRERNDTIWKVEFFEEYFTEAAHEKNEPSTRCA